MIIHQFMRTSHPNQIGTNQTSPFCIYGGPNYRPAAEDAVRKPAWRTHPNRGVGSVLYRRRAVYSHFTPDRPAVWRWERRWMDRHRKEWKESRKLFTPDGGTWQRPLGWGGALFQKPPPDISVCILITARCRCFYHQSNIRAASVLFRTPFFCSGGQFRRLILVQFFFFLKWWGASEQTKTQPLTNEIAWFSASQ